MKVALFEFDGTLDAQEKILRQRVERTKGWNRKVAEDHERLLRVQRAQARRMKREAK